LGRKTQGRGMGRRRAALMDVRKVGVVRGMKRRMEG